MVKDRLLVYNEMNVLKRWTMETKQLFVNLITLFLEISLLMYIFFVPIFYFFKESKKIEKKEAVFLGIKILLGIFLITKEFIGVFEVPSASMKPTIKQGSMNFTNNKYYDFFTPKREDIIVFKEPIYEKYYVVKRLMGLPGETVSINDKNNLIIDDKIQSKREYFNIGNIEDKEFYVPQKGDTVIIKTNKNEIKDFYEKELKKNKLDDNRIEKIPKMEFYVNGKKDGQILELIYNPLIKEALIDKGEAKFVLEENYYFFLGDNSMESIDSRYFGFVGRKSFVGKTMYYR